MQREQKATFTINSSLVAVNDGPEGRRIALPA